MIFVKNSRGGREVNMINNMSKYTKRILTAGQKVIGIIENVSFKA